MMQIWENGENPNYEPNSGLPKSFFMCFTSTGKILFQAIILYNLREN